MELTEGSTVLRIREPRGEPGTVLHLDGDSVFVRWGDGRMGTCSRTELCGAENLSRPAKKKRGKKAGPRA